MLTTGGFLGQGLPICAPTTICEGLIDNTNMRPMLSKKTVVNALNSIWNMCRQVKSKNFFYVRVMKREIFFSFWIPLGPGAYPFAQAHSKPPSTLVHVPFPHTRTFAHSSTSKQRVPLPSSTNPRGHEQRKEPSVLMQSPPCISQVVTQRSLTFCIAEKSSDRSRVLSRVLSIKTIISEIDLRNAVKAMCIHSTTNSL